MYNSDWNVSKTILVTISIILFFVFSAVEYNSYKHAMINSSMDLKDQAEKVRSLLMAFRRYQQQVILKYKIEMDEVHLNFLPAYAIGKISQEYPNWDKSGFTFENVSDDPRNPEHTADIYEKSAIEYFRNNPKEQILFKPIKHDDGKDYYLYARPIWTEQYCLECHGEKEKAPKLIQEKYEKAYGYKVGELRGILSIKLPTAEIDQRAFHTFITALILHTMAFLTILLCIYLVIKNIVINPLKQIESGLSNISKGIYSYRLPKLNGEFNTISKVFNEMVDTIESNKKLLEDMNESLEERVKKRTSELEEATAVISQLNERLKNENTRMSAELEVAKAIQEMVLPKKDELDRIKELDISGYMNSADEVGGDYYDVIKYKNNIKIGIGDVTGHGLESGVVMLMVQTAVRTLLENNVTEPEIFLDALNRSLFSNIKRMHSDKNLTLSLIDYDNGNLKIIGQHEEVLLVRKNGTIERIDTIDLGFMVGLMYDINQFLKEHTAYLNIGDGIVLYTDGITETMNINDDLYGIDRLCMNISNNWEGNTSQYVQDKIIEDVKDFIGTSKPLDDITILVIKRIY